MALESLLITEAPKVFLPLAAKHNALVRLLASLEGAAGIKITFSERNIVIGPDLDPLATALAGTTALYNMAYNASVDAAAAGLFDSSIHITASQVTDFAAAAEAAAAGILPITAADVSDFDAAAVAAVLPITAADVSDFDAAAVAAVLPITAADVSDFDTAAAAAAPVQSVAGRTGAVVLTSTDLSDFAAAAAGAAPVQSVATRTGNVTLAWADLTDVTDETISVCDLGNVTFLTV